MTATRSEKADLADPEAPRRDKEDSRFLQRDLQRKESASESQEAPKIYEDDALWEQDRPVAAKQENLIRRASPKWDMENLLEKMSSLA